MKKDLFIDIKDVTDSREMLSEQPHNFLAWFVYILIALIAAAVVWACVGEIDYYVKAQGEVRPSDKISTIRSGVSGKVAESNLEEGVTVRRGDLLLRFDVESQNGAEKNLQSQYGSVTAEIENLERLRQSIIDGENLFDRSDPLQEDYYYKYENYVTNTASALEQIRNTNADYGQQVSDAKITLANAKSGLARYQSELAGLKALKQSIDGGGDSVPENNTEMRERYKDYLNNMARYDTAIANLTDGRDRANRLFSGGGVSQKEKEKAQFDLDSAILERDKYVSETQLNLSQSITNCQRNIDDLGATVKSAQAVIDNADDKGYNEETTAGKIKLDMLSSISDSLFTLKNNGDALKKELDAVQSAIAEASVTAPIDGVLNLYAEITAGDFVQGGTDIATIVPATGGVYRVVIAVPNSGVADLSEGQTVNYRFAALPYADYGEMQGTIVKISSDARSNNQNQSYYLVEADVNGTVLFNKKGDAGEIKTGMACETRIVTKTRKIIYWVLEKLNFLDD